MRASRLEGEGEGEDGEGEKKEKSDSRVGGGEVRDDRARSETRSDDSRRDEDVARSRRIYDRGEVAARPRRRHGERRRRA